MLWEFICLLVQHRFSSRQGKLEGDCEWEGRRKRQSLWRKALKKPQTNKTKRTHTKKPPHPDLPLISVNDTCCILWIPLLKCCFLKEISVRDIFWKKKNWDTCFWYNNFTDMTLCLTTVVCVIQGWGDYLEQEFCCVKVFVLFYHFCKRGELP